jgi:hypothetical protein
MLSVVCQLIHLFELQLYTSFQSLIFNLALPQIIFEEGIPLQSCTQLLRHLLKDRLILIYHVIKRGGLLCCVIMLIVCHGSGHRSRGLLDISTRSVHHLIWLILRKL